MPGKAGHHSQGSPMPTHFLQAVPTEDLEIAQGVEMSGVPNSSPLQCWWASSQLAFNPFIGWHQIWTKHDQVWLTSKIRSSHLSCLHQDSSGRFQGRATQSIQSVFISQDPYGRGKSVHVNFITNFICRTFGGHFSFLKGLTNSVNYKADCFLPKLSSYLNWTSLILFQLEQFQAKNLVHVFSGGCQSPAEPEIVLRLFKWHCSSSISSPRLNQGTENVYMWESKSTFTPVEDWERFDFHRTFFKKSNSFSCTITYPQKKILSFIGLQVSYGMMERDVVLSDYE